MPTFSLSPSPLLMLASSRNLSPILRKTLPSLKVDTRIFGPCRSPRIATWRPRRAAISRTLLARKMWSSAVPCEKFMRTTLAPAAMIFSRLLSRSVAGPSVVTIFVLLSLLDMLTPFVNWCLYCKKQRVHIGLRCNCNTKGFHLCDPLTSCLTFNLRTLREDFRPDSLLNLQLVTEILVYSGCTETTVPLSKRDSFNASLTRFRLSLNFTPAQRKTGGQYVDKRELGNARDHRHVN